MKPASAAASLIVLGAAVFTGISAAQAEPNCNGFFNNPDGSWTPTHIIVVGSPTSQTPTATARPRAPMRAYAR